MEHQGNNENDSANPMQHPEEQPAGIDESPRFGRLLIVLAIAVMTIGALAIFAGWFYS